MTFIVFKGRMLMTEATTLKLPIFLRGKQRK